jgi:hypothetical protein
VPFGPASLSATLALAELDVCARRPLWRGAFPGSGAACAGLALGSLHADARGLPDTHASSLPYTATTLSLEVLVELDPRTPPGRVAFFVSSALWIPLISPAFELESRSDPSGSLQWQSDAVGFSVRAGPEFRF